MTEPRIPNPALQAFVAQIQDELLIGQVLIQGRHPGYELTHFEDWDRKGFPLQSVRLADMRALAQTTREGRFRPLKAAPNLQNGWRLKVKDDAELETAIHAIYPGAIADWHAAQFTSAPVTHYRPFANRQSGMYRIAKMLSDEQVADVARAGCHRSFCLKRRLWTVKGLGPESAGEKSLIPCLEPCALLLEFARTAMRVEQEPKLPVEFTASDLVTASVVLEAASSRSDPNRREADFEAPDNPRRTRLLLEKLRPLAEKARSTAGE